MAITLIGLQSAIKRKGADPAGSKVYLLQSDTKITDDIDPLLDFSDVPAYDGTWGPTDTDNLRARQKGAENQDDLQGFIWAVSVNFEPPTGIDGEDALDPRDRPWDWSKTPDKRQILAVSSLLDTSGYVYPGSDASSMMNLRSNEMIQNIAGLPFEGGVLRTISRQAITLTKYVTDFTDLGLGSGAALDDLVDTLNRDSITILGIAYNPRELLMDDITYRPFSENGFDTVVVNFRIVADTIYTHVASFLNQGYKQIVSGKLVPILDDAGAEIVEPRLLSLDGTVLPLTGSLLDGIYVSAGLNTEAAWSALTLPETIP